MHNLRKNHLKKVRADFPLFPAIKANTFVFVFFFVLRKFAHAPTKISLYGE
jgi:hypothetical protein